MMSTFYKFCVKFGDLILSLNHPRLNSSRLYIHHSNSVAFSYSLNHFNFFSDERKVQLYHLSEIENIDLKLLKCDSVTWQKILDEIKDAKTGGKRLPEYFKLEQLIELLHCDTYNQRTKFLNYLFTKEKKVLKSAEKLRKKKIDRAAWKKENATLNDGSIQYGLGKNTLILKMLNRNIHKFYDKRMANSVLFGQKLVIDLGYDEFMSIKERRYCASQVNSLKSLNRRHHEPYDLYFCNAKAGSWCVQYLRKFAPNIDDTLTTLTEKNYLDLFQKENLVYLSPHASEALKNYDHKAIYIIGGFVDTVRRDYISLQKAQEEGIRCYSLPLDEYVLWGRGSRSLTIDQVFRIMLTMRDTGDWKQAFKHVPSRKLRVLQTDSDTAQCKADKLLVMKN